MRKLCFPIWNFLNQAGRNGSIVMNMDYSVLSMNDPWVFLMNNP